MKKEEHYNIIGKWKNNWRIVLFNKIQLYVVLPTCGIKAHTVSTILDSVIKGMTTWQYYVTTMRFSNALLKQQSFKSIILCLLHRGHSEVKCYALLRNTSAGKMCARWDNEPKESLWMTGSLRTHSQSQEKCKTVHCVCSAESQVLYFYALATFPFAIAHNCEITLQWPPLVML